ncbi:NAD(P)/FAD-dependent oxidoreductase [Rhodothermus profundi]|uniref:Glycine/D-amino acid oxidase n=1 Tax=Rhodothermus profundi TaxID=633813 RepID=A0A1M6TF32_9BACT|nr:FAD-dependent oxidoreductase [Rhodothermus profundi]SHK55446.1 Glycine/D-amino acid oxidase [Rhodothermus profundi]
MQPSPSIGIVGAGLAGACAAFALHRQAHVEVFEATDATNQAFRATGGLFHPLMTRRARPNWQHEAALTALEQLLAEVGDQVPVRRGLLRVAFDERQAADFREAACAYPHWVQWLSPEAVRERFPQVRAPYGALWISQGGALSANRLIDVLLARSGVPVHRPVRVVDWEETSRQVLLHTDRGDTHAFDYVILAPGYGYRLHPELARLPFQAVKGQVISLAGPASLATLPLVLATVHLVPSDGLLFVGSSYEPAFTDLAPSDAQTHRLWQEATRWVPEVMQGTVVAALTGVRVIRPRRPLPVLSPLPGRQRLWLFSGLGSRGLLYAPLLASWLPEALREPERLPAAVRL